ncbi:hypothetical protein [Achromobacter phage tuull]|nr:hypothetical protein [Achromobacter phage tuull]
MHIVDSSDLFDFRSLRVDGQEAQHYEWYSERFSSDIEKWQKMLTGTPRPFEKSKDGPQ